MSKSKPTETRNRHTADGTIPLILAGSIGATIACLTILTGTAPSQGSLLEDPPRSFLAGLSLVGLACPLYVAAYLLRGLSPAWRRWEGRVAALVLSIASLCLAFGLIGIVLGVYPLVRLL